MKGFGARGGRISLEGGGLGIAPEFCIELPTAEPPRSNGVAKPPTGDLLGLGGEGGGDGGLGGLGGL